MKTVLYLIFAAIALFFIVPHSCQRAVGSIYDLVAMGNAELVEATEQPGTLGESETSGTREAAEPKEESLTKRTLSRQKEVFGRIIGEFGDESDGLKDVLEEGTHSLENFRSAIREVRDRDAEFDRVYVDWEKVSSNTAVLKKQFEQLVEGAAEFYATAEEHAETIHDETLRTESLDYIHQSQSSYLERLEETKVAIQQVDAMKVAVDDTMKAMEIRFAVDIVDRRIAEMFEQIDQMVDDVLRALNDLEVESQQVLGQFG